MDTEKQLQIVSFEQAKRLALLGFDWNVHYHYNIKDLRCMMHSPIGNYNDSNGLFYSAPTVALALKYLRTAKKLYGYLGRDFIKNVWYIVLPDDDVSEINFSTYQEAEIYLLEELLNLN